MSSAPLPPPRRLVEFELDGETVPIPEGATILDACRRTGIAVPTLCWGDTLTPKNACRVCVVEVEGSRALVPACSRRAEPGMVVRTGSERVRFSRRMVLEFLASSVDLSTTPGVEGWLADYGADPARYGPTGPVAEAGERDRAVTGAHPEPDGTTATTVGQPAKVDNDLYVRDYAKCILCSPRTKTHRRRPGDV